MNNKKGCLYGCLTAIGIFIVLLILLGSCSAILSDKGSDEVITENSQEEIAEADTSTTADTKTTTPSVTTYSSGTYKVGDNLPAGDYVAVDCNYIEISSDSSGEFESILSNEASADYAYVYVQDGEYIKISGGKLIPLAETTPLDQASYSDGIYLIGRDIPAGEYQLTTNGSGYWERNSMPISGSGGFNTIIANDNFDGSTYVTVNDGEYLKLSNGATLTK